MQFAGTGAASLMERLDAEQLGQTAGQTSPVEFGVQAAFQNAVVLLAPIFH
jgi:hypothetical protein